MLFVVGFHASCVHLVSVAHDCVDGSSVILRDKRDASHEGKLIRLGASKTTASHRGIIKHADIIGKEPREFVQASNGSTFRLHEPTLAEYIRLTPRLVTPVRHLISFPLYLHYLNFRIEASKL